MLTGFAILERELGAIDYRRHQLETRLRGRLSAAETKQVREELGALEKRRRLTLQRLDALHDEWEARHAPADAGRALRGGERPKGPQA